MTIGQSPWGAALAALMLATAGPTGSQEISPRFTNPDNSWEVVRVGPACAAILHSIGELETTWGSGVDVPFRWSGPCGPDGLITGTGVLTTDFVTRTGTRFRTERRGTANGGLFEGDSQTATYSEEGGVMDLHYFGDVRNPMPESFSGGCEYSTGPGGRRPVYDGCDPADAAAIQRAVRDRGLATMFGWGNDAGGADAKKPASVEPAGAEGQCAATPDESLVRFNADFGAWTRRYPTPSAEAGARAQYQYAYFLGTTGLDILESYRPCLGPHFEANETALKEMRDKGRDGCLALSTSQECRPDPQ